MTLANRLLVRSRHPLLASCNLHCNVLLDVLPAHECCQRVKVLRSNILFAFLQLRYIGRGNLVVVPPTLAMQWKQEIKARTTQAQKVIVVDDLKERRKYMSSREGMRECARLLFLPCLCLCAWTPACSCTVPLTRACMHLIQGATRMPSRCPCFVLVPEAKPSHRLSLSAPPARRRSPGRRTAEYRLIYNLLEGGSSCQAWEGHYHDFHGIFWRVNSGMGTHESDQDHALSSIAMVFGQLYYCR
jgi:hypothetical protein